MTPLSLNPVFDSLDLVIDTVVAGKAFRSPDHYLNGRIAANYPAEAGFEARRSGGFEPMAKSLDGKTLYPMLEWPLWDAAAKAQESRNGKPYTRILELDAAAASRGRSPRRCAARALIASSRIVWVDCRCSSACTT